MVRKCRWRECWLVNKSTTDHVHHLVSKTLKKLFSSHFKSSSLWIIRPEVVTKTFKRLVFVPSSWKNHRKSPRLEWTVSKNHSNFEQKRRIPIRGGTLDKKVLSTKNKIDVVERNTLLNRPEGRCARRRRRTCILDDPITTFRPSTLAA